MNDMATADGVAGIVNFLHHPFGNAYFKTNECGGGPYSSATRHCWATTCVESRSPPADCFSDVSSIVVQHGPTEGEVNRMQACAKTMTAADVHWSERYWPFVFCMESNYEKLGVRAARQCAVGANLTYPDLDGCYSGAEGDMSVIREAKATIDHPGTPYIAVDGKAVESGGILAAVCAAWRGPTPAGCK